MSTEVADPKALSDVIRERMDAKITELMPDEVFDKMFEAAVRRLVTPPPKEYAHEKAKPAPLETMIYDALAERMNEKIKELFETSEWRERTGSVMQGVNLNGAIEKVIAEHAASIFAKMVTSGVQMDIEAALHNKFMEKGIY